MHATVEQTRPDFKGSPEHKERAEHVFNLTSATARFFSPTAEIAIPLKALAEHFATVENADVDSMSETIEAALASNDHIFARDERDGEIYFVTTRAGVVPAAEPEADTAHSFAQRFADPPPIPESAVPPRRARARQSAEVADADEIVTEADADEIDVEDDTATAEAEPAARVPEPATADVVETVVDLADATDEEIAQALFDQLAYDYAVANVGDLWMAEDKVNRLSRGDSRRIREYIEEKERPVSDHEIVQDVLGIRQNAQEYELHLFSVNFRLSRESREFEFVGIPDVHLWTISSLDTPDVVNRKPNEVSQDYRVLLDLDDEPTLVDEGVVEHVLTFYEHRHGVLPYDASFQTLIPGAVLQGQRSAIIQFDSPATNESFPVQVRFPTGNRGGFLTGFGDFFAEHLVPGAFVTIEAGDEPGKFTIEFLTVSGQDRKLLTLDERKNEYTFESRTFYSAPNEDMLISENRFPKLAGTAPLDERTRRQPAAVLAHAFQIAGEKLDADSDQLMSVMDELVAAANIERPMPAALIRSIAASDNHPEFSLDPEADDVVYYRPGTDSDSTD